MFCKTVECGTSWETVSKQTMVRLTLRYQTRVFDKTANFCFHKQQIKPNRRLIQETFHMIHIPVFSFSRNMLNDTIATWWTILWNNKTFCNTHIIHRSILTRFPLWLSAPSMAVCSLYGPLPALCTTLFPSTTLYPLPPPWSFTQFMAFCPLCGPFNLCHPLSPLRPHVPSTALCPLRTLWPSTALCFLNSPLFPQQPSVISMALCLLYGPLSPIRLSIT